MTVRGIAEEFRRVSLFAALASLSITDRMTSRTVSIHPHGCVTLWIHKNHRFMDSHVNLKLLLKLKRNSWVQKSLNPLGSGRERSERAEGASFITLDTNSLKFIFISITHTFFLFFKYSSTISIYTLTRKSLAVLTRTKSNGTLCVSMVNNVGVFSVSNGTAVAELRYWRI